MHFLFPHSGCWGGRCQQEVNWTAVTKAVKKGFEVGVEDHSEEQLGGERREADIVKSK